MKYTIYSGCWAAGGFYAFFPKKIQKPLDKAKTQRLGYKYEPKEEYFKDILKTRRTWHGICSLSLSLSLSLWYNCIVVFNALYASPTRRVSPRRETSVFSPAAIYIKEKGLGETHAVSAWNLPEPPGRL
jgi:hypothetical protein